MTLIWVNKACPSTQGTLSAISETTLSPPNQLMFLEAQTDQVEELECLDLQVVQVPTVHQEREILLQKDHSVAVTKAWYTVLEQIEADPL
jgi:hypothetical protein